MFAEIICFQASKKKKNPEKYYNTINNKVCKLVLMYITITVKYVQHVKYEDTYKTTLLKSLSVTSSCDGRIFVLF